MAKPPETPASSDISGPNRDRVRIDRPENADADDSARLEEGNDEARARPESDSGSEAIGD